MELISVLFLILIFLNLVSGENISVSYPNNLNYGEKFQVGLDLEGFSGIYDVKIDILGGGKRLARIFNNEIWQSTYSYVPGIVDTTKTNSYFFLLNVTEKYNGNAEMNITLRKDSKLSKFTGYNIFIFYQEEKEENKTNNEDNQEEDKDNDDKEKISLNIDYDEEFYNDEEIKIKIEAENLEEYDYDLKAYIQNEGKIISEVYDKENEKWKSGNYYVNNILTGPGLQDTSLKLRLKDKNFSGDATINVKIRKNGWKVEAEEDMDIEIKERKNIVTGNTVVDSSEEKKDVGIETKITQQEIVRLNPQDIKTQEIWNSKQGYIKEYGIYAFIIFCFILMIFAIIKLIRRI